MRQIAWGTLATALIASTAMAQEPARPLSLSQQIQDAAMAQATAGAAAAPQAPASAPAATTVAVTAGVDFPTLYFFRGIRQEADANLTVQPWLDVAVSGSSPVSVNFGTWNSFHSGSNKDAATRGAHAWYESDLYAQATYSAGKFKPALLYTAYTSPAGNYQAVSELAGVFTYDDSSMTVPMSPKIVLAFETSKAQADGGAHRGVYLELGVKPTFKAGEKLSVGIPLKLGMSLKDYYEGPNGDSKFGYFDIGLAGSVPVSDMVEFHAGVDLLAFGDTLKAFNADKSTQAVGNIGFGFTF
jgi:hypothetical protein